MLLRNWRVVMTLYIPFAFAKNQFHLKTGIQKSRGWRFCVQFFSENLGSRRVFCNKKRPEIIIPKKVLIFWKFRGFLDENLVICLMSILKKPMKWDILWKTAYLSFNCKLLKTLFFSSEIFNKNDQQMVIVRLPVTDFLKEVVPKYKHLGICDFRLF